jgi:hypothetical protein
MQRNNDALGFACPKNHVMNRAYFSFVRKMDLEYIGGLYCDVCNTHFDSKKGQLIVGGVLIWTDLDTLQLYHCFKCGYDVCINCYNAMKKEYINNKNTK